MKKIIAGLMIAAAMFTFGCSGRNSDFGTVDMSTGDDAKKVAEDYGAKAKLIQSEAQNKLKASLDTALKQVADEKKLGAILDKRAVPQGGTDVTGDVIAKMK